MANEVGKRFVVDSVVNRDGSPSTSDGVGALGSIVTPMFNLEAGNRAMLAMIEEDRTIFTSTLERVCFESDKITLYTRNSIYTLRSAPTYEGNGIKVSD